MEQIKKVTGPDFGLIEPVDGSDDVFFHFSEVLAMGFFRPEAGENVEFGVGRRKDGKRVQAVRVKRLHWKASYHPD